MLEQPTEIYIKNINNKKKNMSKSYRIGLVTKREERNCGSSYYVHKL